MGRLIPGLSLMALAAALAVALAGCQSPCAFGWSYEPYPRSPFVGTVKVAVAPFVTTGIRDARTREKAERFAGLFATELAKFEGFQVIRPSLVRDAMRAEGTVLDSSSAALRLARTLKADAILVGEVTDFRDFLPKRVGLALQLYPVRSAWRGAAGDPRRLERHGKPFGYEQEGRGNRPLIEIERVMDAHYGEVRQAARRFGCAHDPERPLDDLGQEAFISITDLYLQFVSNRMVHEIFAVEQARLEERHAKEKAQRRNQAEAAKARERMRRRP